jgi:hypothetical protein
MIELWRRLTLQWMTQMELHSQRQLMQSWSAWTKFKHSLFVYEDKSREADSE